MDKQNTVIFQFTFTPIREDGAGVVKLELFGNGGTAKATQEIKDILVKAGIETYGENYDKTEKGLQEHHKLRRPIPLDQYKEILGVTGLTVRKTEFNHG